MPNIGNKTYNILLLTSTFNDRIAQSFRNSILSTIFIYHVEWENEHTKLYQKWAAAVSESEFGKALYILVSRILRPRGFAVSFFFWLETRVFCGRLWHSAQRSVEMKFNLTIEMTLDKFQLQWRRWGPNRFQLHQKRCDGITDPRPNSVSS